MATLTIESIASSDYLAWRYPKREVTLGSQVIVNESEQALLFENGKLIHVLSAGRHLIESGNIPGLDGVLRRTLGNNSPLKIDIWFVTKTSSSDYKWGVQLKVKDTNHQLIVPVGAYGSMMLRIDDPASFLIQVVGKDLLLTKKDLRSFILPSIERSLKDYIAEKIGKGSLDIFNIDSVLVEASNHAKSSLSSTLERFGMNLLDFYIQGIEVIGDNPEYLKIKEALGDAASLRIRAKAASDTEGFYQQERTLDAIDKVVAKDTSVGSKLISQSLGEIQIGSNVINEPNSETKKKLLELKELLNSGLISEHEYQNKRIKLLGKI